MKSLTSIQLVVLIGLSSCGPQDANDRKATTSTQAKPVETPQKPAIIAPKSVTEQPKVEVPTDVQPAPTEVAQKIMQRRKSSDFELASKQFGELLQQQQSSIVGRPIAEVKKLLGRPDAETDTSIAYRFEAGFGGWDWVLEHNGKNVLSFTRKGVN